MTVGGAQQVHDHLHDPAAKPTPGHHHAGDRLSELDPAIGCMRMNTSGFTNCRGNFIAKNLDRPHQVRMYRSAHIHMRCKAGESEHFFQLQDFINGC